MRKSDTSGCSSHVHPAGYDVGAFTLAGVYYTHHCCVRNCVCMYITHTYAHKYTRLHTNTHTHIPSVWGMMEYCSFRT